MRTGAILFGMVFQAPTKGPDTYIGVGLQDICLINEKKTGPCPEVVFVCLFICFVLFWFSPSEVDYSLKA